MAVRLARFGLGLGVVVAMVVIIPQSRFDGVFANASLFHVPSQELPRVLLELRKTLRPRGVLLKPKRKQRGRL